MCTKLTQNVSHRNWHDWVPGIDYVALCPGLPIQPDDVGP
jgi:hypothetical protein